MKKCNLLVWALSAGFLMGSNCLAQSHSITPGNEDIQKRELTVIENDDEAISRAIYYMGLEHVMDFEKGSNINAEKAIITDDKTPTIRHMINNREIWLVEMKDIPISIFSYIRKKSEQNATFSIYLDPDNGKLLKISSKLRDEEFYHSKKDSIDLIEKNRALSGYNITLPDTLYHSFIFVVRNCPINIFAANEIEALYILTSKDNNKEPKLRWKISLFGSPYVITAPPHTDPSDSTKIIDPEPRKISAYKSIVIDGETGKTLSYSAYGE